MRIEVWVKPRAKKTEVEKRADGKFVVKVKEPANEGKANQAVIEVLAKYFAIPKQAVTIVRGRTSRNKLIEVSDT